MEVSDFNKFALDYHSKRKKPWKSLKIFIDQLKNDGHTFNGVILDLGCANARNFKIIGDFPKKIIGIDKSIELLKIANENLKNVKNFPQAESNFYQVLLGDLNFLPIRPNSINNIFSIAVIHHIKTKLNREKILHFSLEILKKEGAIILTVWRKWQKKYRRYFLVDLIKRRLNSKYKQKQESIGLSEFGDKFVPWGTSTGNFSYNRFYHFFSKLEIKDLLNDCEVKVFKIMGGPTNNDNFFIAAYKKLMADKSTIRF